MDENKKTLRGKFLQALQYAKNPTADRRNPHYQSRYASLAAIVDEIRRAQLTHDVAYSFRYADGVLTSYIFDGETAEDLSALPVVIDDNPQITGSRLTYAKRQLAQIDWALCADEDDDGNAAAGAVTPVTKREEPAATQEVESQPITLVCKSCGFRKAFRSREAAVTWFQKTRGDHLTPDGTTCANPNLTTA